MWREDGNEPAPAKWHLLGVVAELSSPQDSPSEFCMLTSRYDEARTSPLPDEELEII